MSRLRFHRILLRSISEKSVFEADVRFAEGFTVLWADNTMGKSTCLNAVMYALGMEGIWGSGDRVPLPAAMTSRIEDEAGDKHHVLESYCMLEFSGMDAAPRTVRRHVRHATKERKLIESWEAPLEAVLEGAVAPPRHYYVKRSHAATREGGFHAALPKWIGWTLPEVTTYQDDRSLLYVETLFPYLFVEQKRGWQPVHLRMPGYLGIREADRRSLEFVLNLDAGERGRRLQTLRAQEAALRNSWSESVASFRAGASKEAISVEGLPDALGAEWPPTPEPQLFVTDIDDGEARTVALAHWLELTRHQLHEWDRAAVPRVAAVSAAVERSLRAAEQELQDVVALGHRAAERDSRLRIERAAVSTRITAVDEDIQRYDDVRILTTLGAEHGLDVADDRCPTCRRSLGGTLIAVEHAEVADVPSTLDALKEQRHALEGLSRRLDRDINDQQRLLEAAQRKATQLREAIRAQRRTLRSSAESPSEEHIRRRLLLEQRVDRADLVDAQWTELKERLGELSARYRAVAEEIRELKDSVLSDEDGSKLLKLRSVVRSQLAAYGFTSCAPAEIAISPTTYRLVTDGLDLGIDMSASDQIRAVWAHLLGLVELSGEFEDMRHPGVLIFDEPRQQSTRDLSFEALLQHAAAVCKEGHQVIFATSEKLDRLRGWLPEGANLVATRGRMLQPRRTLTSE